MEQRTVAYLDLLWIWLADSQEVRAEASNEPLDEDLKHSGSDQGVEQAKDSVVEVPEAPNADLHEEKHSQGDEAGKQCGGPDGDDLAAKRVGEVRVRNVAIIVVDGERTRRSWAKKVDTESEGAHGCLNEK